MNEVREAFRRLGAPQLTPRDAFEHVRWMATGGVMSRRGQPGEVIARAASAVRAALSRLTADDLNHDVRTETFLAFIEPPTFFQRIARRR